MQFLGKNRLAIALYKIHNLRVVNKISTLNNSPY